MREEKSILVFRSHEIDFEIKDLVYCDCIDGSGRSSLDYVTLTLDISPELKKDELFSVLKQIQENFGAEGKDFEYEIQIKKVEKKGMKKGSD